MIKLILTLITAHLWMLGCWGVYQIMKKEVIADIAWALGILLQGAIYYHFSGHTLAQSYLILLLIIWSFRLSGFLFWNRILKPWHDKRYEKIIERSANSTQKTIFINYQIQAFLQWVLGLVWFFIMQNEAMHVLWLKIASLLFVVGLLIEIVADEQLKYFKKNPNTPVCQIGLWRYSRHPNYCGEIIIWISFAVANQQILGFIAPLTLYLIMRYVTGPLTEETSIVHRGQAYLNYQKTTPMIWPYKLFCSKRSK